MSGRGRGGDLMRQGLYLDMSAWGYHVFTVSAAGVTKRRSGASSRETESAVEARSCTRY